MQARKTTGSITAIRVVVESGIEPALSLDITTHGLMSNGREIHNQSVRPRTNTTHIDPTIGQVRVSRPGHSTNAVSFSVNIIWILVVSK